MNYPSIKAIANKLSIDTATARLIRGFMDGTEDPLSVPSVRQYSDGCIHGNHRYLLVLMAIDSLLENCGIESIALQDKPSFNGCDRFIDYSNTGDSYAATVLYFTAEKRFRIGCWADYVG